MPYALTTGGVLGIALAYFCLLCATDDYLSGWASASFALGGVALIIGAIALIAIAWSA